MGWTKVTGMPLTPHACVACGQNPSDVEGNFDTALFAEGVDVDWGNSVYLCSSCQNVIVELITGYTIEQVAELDDKLKSSRKEFNDEKKAHDKLKKRVKTMLKGARAKEKVSNAS